VSSNLIVMIGPLAAVPLVVALVMLAMRSVRRPGEDAASPRKPSAAATATWLLLGLTTTLGWSLVVLGQAVGMSGVP